MFMKKMGNMLCNRCKVNPAEVFMTSLVANQKIEEMLCLECAIKTDELSMILNNDARLRKFMEEALKLRNMDMRKTVMKQDYKKYEAQKDRTSKVLDIQEDCPVCGMGLEEIFSSGMAGCSNCYVLFEKELDKLLKLKHSSFYKGSRPQGIENKKEDTPQKLIVLKERLKDSIRREEYEQAGLIKAEINRLEKINKNI